MEVERLVEEKTSNVMRTPLVYIHILKISIDGDDCYDGDDNMTAMTMMTMTKVMTKMTMVTMMAMAMTMMAITMTAMARTELYCDAQAGKM